MARNLRAHRGGLIGASVAVLAAAFLAPHWLPAPDLQENRALAERPKSPHAWAEWRAWPKAADAYVADHFPPRQLLIGWLNLLRSRIGRSGSANVMVGRDGWLFYDNGTHLGAARNDPAYTDAQAREWLTALAGRSEAIQREGAVYLIVAAPEKETLFAQYGPRWYRGPDRNRPAVLLNRLAARSKAGELIYLHEDLIQPTRWGLKTYSAHDTHWTGLGAYYGYAAVMRRLQALGAVSEGPRPIDAFEEVHDLDPHKPRNLALMLGVASFVPVDYPELGDPEAEDRIRITWLTPAQDWTAPQVVDTGQTGKPVLLMTRDSFSNALTPFLYRHFSRIVLAHNQDGPWREDLVRRFKPDVVILEVVESGLPMVLSPAPPASEAARRRIEAALAEPHRVPQDQAIEAPRRPTPPTVAGGPGEDFLKGGDAAEFILARPGDDMVEASGGDDIIRAGVGNDTVSAGPGDDWISGDKDADVLRGGPGADVFVIRSGAGVDRVLDFSPAQGDRVVVEPGPDYAVRQEGAHTVIVLDGARLVLEGVRAADLPARAIRRR